MAPINKIPNIAANNHDRNVNRVKQSEKQQSTTANINEPKKSNFSLLGFISLKGISKIIDMKIRIAGTICNHCQPPTVIITLPING